MQSTEKHFCHAPLHFWLYVYNGRFGEHFPDWQYMKIRICLLRILMYKFVRMWMQILKKIKYDTINTDNMMQSTDITSNDCQCECKIEF